MRPIALVTGASRGIGAQTAIKLASQGYDIAINFNTNLQAAEAVKKHIMHEKQNPQSRVEIYQADLTYESQVEALFASIQSTLGLVTHLVNNAGIVQPQTRVEEMSAERINLMLTTNVTPYFICAREAIKHFRQADDPSQCAIVNVSSAASYLGGANEYVDYAASKGAIDSFTKGLSLELAAERIRVNGVRPGCIYTDIHADGGEPYRVERLASSLPMQRGGNANEVANAIAWLLSDEASFVTGSFIDLAGGK